MTKREMFNAAIAVIEGREVEVDRVELIEGLSHEIELLERKSNSPKKPTKTQIENDGFKAEIVAHLTEVDTPKTIKELQAEIPSISGLTNQRITHMLTDLRKDGKVARTYVKKVAYFALGCENESEGE